MAARHLPATYNQRLFSGGARKWLHEQRFRWLRSQTAGMCGAVFELGCFDARSLEFLAFKPERYLGVDAGWEGGLRAAMAKYPHYEFRRAQNLYQPPERFDLAIALETLEHLPRQELPDYLNMLASAAPILLATVPVEIGPVFLAKHVAKLVLGSSDKYSASEALLSTFGFGRHVEQDQHKGFDFRLLIQMLRTRYNTIRVQGLPFGRIPLLSFTVAIRAEA